MEQVDGSSFDPEVKMIWSGMVKPLHPTLSNDLSSKRRLSFLDYVAAPIHVPTILFYSARGRTVDDDELMTRLKVSLSEALSHFYPLAGRFLDETTLICNDEGALLIHTQVPSTLSAYFSLIHKHIYSDHQNEHTNPPLSTLLPARHLLHIASSDSDHKVPPIPISGCIQLAFQVNMFACGGVVIGCQMSHKLLDGISEATFLRYWANLSSKSNDINNVEEPNFDAIVAAFPPAPYGLDNPPRKNKSMDKWMMETVAPSLQDMIVFKVFVLTPSSISAIREKSVSDRIPNPKRIESVLGFLWKHCLEAEVVDHEVDHTTLRTSSELVLAADMRRRAQPPLPRESIGNLATSVMAQAPTTAHLGNLVAEIRGALTELEDEKVIEFQGEKGGEAFGKYQQMISQLVTQNKPTTYKASSLCRAGHTDMDFGFGNPIWVSGFDGVTNPWLKNVFVLMDHMDPIDSSTRPHSDHGIQAWIFLGKKQMQILETNPHFLALASPLNLIPT